jgi:hypothetical protein
MHLPGAQAAVHVAEHQLHLAAMTADVLHTELLLQLRLLRLVGKRPIYVHPESGCGCLAVAQHRLVR